MNDALHPDIVHGHGVDTRESAGVTEGPRRMAKETRGKT